MDARFKIVLQPGKELFLDSGTINMADYMNHPPPRWMDTSTAYPLLITNAFLKAFHGFTGTITFNEQDVCKQRFFDSLGIIGYSRRLWPPKEICDIMPVSAERLLVVEVIALRFAVNEWLYEQKRPVLYGAEALYMPGDGTMEPVAAACLYHRLQEAPATIESMQDGSLARCHESDSLLALAWAEIWHALDNHIRVRICPYCSAVFKVPVSHPKMHNCKSNECRTKHKIDSHGGPDCYRIWETENKKKRKDGRPPGRPRKQDKIKRRVGRPRKFGKCPPGKG
jgi:hypothetical protein